GGWVCECAWTLPRIDRRIGFAAIAAGYATKPLGGSSEHPGATPVSQSPSAPKFAAAKLFRGSNKGTDALIGREKEFADLDATWSGAGKKNVVTIVAWGGVGKT